MKKRRYLTVVTAAVLAVSPVVASSVFAGQSAVHTVKAATELSSDELMAPYYQDAKQNMYDNDILVRLTKATPYITARAGEKASQVAKQRITDVTSNYGHVSKLADENGIVIYKTFDNGRPDFSQRLDDGDRLEQGQSYVASLAFVVNGADNEDGNTDCIGLDYGSLDSDLTKDYLEFEDNEARILVPVHVTAASHSSNEVVVKTPSKETTKKTATRKRTTTRRRVTKRRRARTHRAYVKVRKNRRVRTYTSTGRFSRHYVYGRHSYKVTTKKRIRRHGYCWKVAGKNQYIPAKYIRVR